MNIDKAVNLDEIREAARRKLPRIAFDFIDGGADDEIGMQRNREAFRRYCVVTRYLVDVSKPDQSVTLFGQTYASPIGISPTGMGGLFRPNADLMLAEAAARANVPYLMSSASNNSIEAAMKVAPETTWFQVYGTHDEKITDDLARRARDLGVKNLVFTVDVPATSNRERNRRNGFSRPFRLTPAVALEALGHPLWVLRYMRTGGLPMMENWQPYGPKGATPDQIADLFGSLTPASGQTWSTLERIRQQWPGNLIVKGILHPDDARSAADLGANGIIVSNHGARQLDIAPSPIDMLPAIRDAVGDRVELMLDSGVRRGSDIIIALCLGAKFTFFGRPTLYAVAAGGQAGAEKALTIVRNEIKAVMTQMGCTSLANLGPEWLRASGYCAV